MLELRDISVRYGAVTAVSNVCLTLKPGQLTVLDGHHGAGKSSFLKAAIGAVISTGQVLLSNQIISRRNPSKMANLGVVLAPEGRHIFPTLTTRENLEFALAVTGRPASLDQILTYFPDLEPLLSQPALSLSGGQAQMLSLARAMLCTPKFILLDEPLLGLSEQPKMKVWSAIQDMRRNGVGILVTGDHNISDVTNVDQFMSISNSYLCEKIKNES